MLPLPRITSRLGATTSRLARRLPLLAVSRSGRIFPPPPLHLSTAAKLDETSAILERLRRNIQDLRKSDAAPSPKVQGQVIGIDLAPTTYSPCIESDRNPRAIDPDPRIVDRERRRRALFSKEGKAKTSPKQEPAERGARDAEKGTIMKIELGETRLPTSAYLAEHAHQRNLLFARDRKAEAEAPPLQDRHITFNYPDINYGTLRTEVAELLRKPYLGPARPEKLIQYEAGELTTAYPRSSGHVDGILFGQGTQGEPRVVLPFPVSYEDPAYPPASKWVFFVYDPSVRASYLSHEAAAALGVEIPRSEPEGGRPTMFYVRLSTQMDVLVPHGVFVNPPGNYLYDVNILGRDWGEGWNAEVEEDNAVGTVRVRWQLKGLEV